MQAIAPPTVRKLFDANPDKDMSRVLLDQAWMEQVRKQRGNVELYWVFSLPDYHGSQVDITVLPDGVFTSEAELQAFKQRALQDGVSPAIVNQW